MRVMKPQHDRPWRGSQAPTIAMWPIESSSVAAAGYDVDRKILRLRYSGGATYDYADVPQEVFAAFVAAPSRGQFVNQHIKPCYACSRLR
jgi:hypothetical protein